MILICKTSTGHEGSCLALEMLLFPQEWPEHGIKALLTGTEET